MCERYVQTFLLHFILVCFVASTAAVSIDLGVIYTAPSNSKGSYIRNIQASIHSQGLQTSIARFHFTQLNKQNIIYDIHHRQNPNNSQVALQYFELNQTRWKYMRIFAEEISNKPLADCPTSRFVNIKSVWKCFVSASVSARWIKPDVFEMDLTLMQRSSYNIHLVKGFENCTVPLENLSAVEWDLHDFHICNDYEMRHNNPFPIPLVSFNLTVPKSTSVINGNHNFNNSSFFFYSNGVWQNNKWISDFSLPSRNLDGRNMCHGR